MKSFFEEHGDTYTQVGDYLLPNLVMDPQPEDRHMGLEKKTVSEGASEGHI